MTNQQIQASLAVSGHAGAHVSGMDANDWLRGDSVLAA